MFKHDSTLLPYKMVIQNNNENHTNRSHEIKFRNLEKISLKYSASKAHRQFNITCIYIYIYIYSAVLETLYRTQFSRCFRLFLSCIGLNRSFARTKEDFGALITRILASSLGLISGIGSARHQILFLKLVSV